MTVLRRWRNFDFLLLVAAIALIVYGVALIYSATRDQLPDELPFGQFVRELVASGSFVSRQIAYGAVGLVLVAAIASCDYRWLRRAAVPLYVLVVLLLAVVFALGEVNYGSRRWLSVNVFLVQPSELAKLGFILLLAKYLADNEARANSARVFLVSLLLLALPAGLIFLQPDLGTVAMFLMAWAGMMVVGNGRRLYLAASGILGVAALPILYVSPLPVLHGYMRDRIDTFLNPLADPTGAGYNVLQAETAIGSGGLLGRGFLNGSQTQLNFLRVQYTDFIFSVLGEELGFLGAMVLFGLFLILLLRGLHIAGTAPDSFGRLVATGIVMLILTQIFINLGVNERLLPVTGVPLPFISYGGSSLLTMMISLGILESIALRRQRDEAKWSPGKGLAP